MKKYCPYLTKKNRCKLSMTGICYVHNPTKYINFEDNYEVCLYYLWEKATTKEDMK